MLLFHGICWAFIVFGAIGVAGILFAFTAAEVIDYSSVAPWVFVSLGVGICALFMLIGAKGLKLRSTSDLEAQDAVYEQRKAKLEAWVNGAFRR